MNVLSILTCLKALVLALAFSTGVLCQDVLSAPENKIGISYSRADQTWLSVDYIYEADVFKVLYHDPIYSGNSIYISWTLEAIYGASWFYTDNLLDELSSGYESGLNIGLKFDKLLAGKGFQAFVHLHSGPYYISDAPDRQIPGLMISSGLDVGVEAKIITNLSVAVFLGFRHMSNGEIRLPNGGLNNLVKGFAFSMGI